jgi:hypothetical protein
MSPFCGFSVLGLFGDVSRLFIKNNDHDTHIRSVLQLETEAGLLHEEGIRGGDLPSPGSQGRNAGKTELCF